jgi:excisionase family DNA binding protein
MTGDQRLTTTEAARRLGMEPEDVYRLLFAGELEGQPDPDGVVRISERAVEDYLERQAHV